MLRRRQLRERHAIWWLFAGGLALVVSVFPSIVTNTAELLGFEVPTNLVFFASLVILFLVALQTSAELTKVESHNRNLAEQMALLKERIERLENK